MILKITAVNKNSGAEFEVQEIKNEWWGSDAHKARSLLGTSRKL